MRYLWVQREEYFGPGRAGLLTRIGFRAVEPYLRRWDLRTAANPRPTVDLKIVEHFSMGFTPLPDTN